MQVHKIQNNNLYATFKSNKKIKNLQIDNKNPLITEDVRNVANGLNKFLNSIAGKTLNIDGMSIGSPVETYLYATLKDIDNQKKVKLDLSKDSKYAEQITTAKFYITAKDGLTSIIEYCPRRNGHGVWMDDLLSYNVCESFYGEEYYNYTRTVELNDIFVKYGRKFLAKFEKIAKYYK